MTGVVGEWPPVSSTEETRETLAEALWGLDGYDLNADPTSRTARNLRPDYLRRADQLLAAGWSRAAVDDVEVARRAVELAELLTDAIGRISVALRTNAKGGGVMRARTVIASLDQEESHE